MHSADFLQLPSLSPLSPRFFPAHSLGPFGNFVLLFCSFLLPALLHFVNIKLWARRTGAAAAARKKRMEKRINELLKFPKWKQEHEHENGPRVRAQKQITVTLTAVITAVCLPHSAVGSYDTRWEPIPSNTIPSHPIPYHPTDFCWLKGELLFRLL